MSGLEVVGVLASVTQILDYSAKIICCLHDAYERASGKSDGYQRQCTQIKQVVRMVEFIRSVDSLQTELVIDHLRALDDRVRDLYGTVSHASEHGRLKFLRRFVKEIWAHGSVPKCFAALESTKNSLAVCILAQYGNELVDIRHKLEIDHPLIEGTASKVENIEVMLHAYPEVLREVQEVRRLLVQSTQRLTEQGMRLRVSDLIQDDCVIDAAQSPISDSTTIADIQDASYNVSEPTYQTEIDHNQPQYPQMEYEGSLCGNFNSKLALIGERDGSTLSNGEVEHGPMTTPANSPTAQGGYTSPEIQTEYSYKDMLCLGNAVQVNGKVGSSEKVLPGFHSYLNVVAEGESRQINGDVYSADIILSLLTR